MRLWQGEKGVAEIKKNIRKFEKNKFLCEKSDKNLVTKVFSNTGVLDFTAWNWLCLARGRDCTTTADDECEADDRSESAYADWRGMVWVAYWRWCGYGDRGGVGRGGGCLSAIWGWNERFVVALRRWTEYWERKKRKRIVRCVGGRQVGKLDEAVVKKKKPPISDKKMRPGW